MENYPDKVYLWNELDAYAVQQNHPFLPYDIKIQDPLDETVDDLYPANGEVIVPDGQDSTDFEIFVKDDKVRQSSCFS